MNYLSIIDFSRSGGKAAGDLGCGFSGYMSGRRDSRCLALMPVTVSGNENQSVFSAYSPDMDGCIATGNTKEEVEKNMKEAVEFHLEGLRLERQETPKPHSYHIQVM